MATIESTPIGDQPSPSRTPHATTTDPVCGMQVEKADSSLTIEYKGHEYKFCSTTCRDTFRANPEKFV